MLHVQPRAHDPSGSFAEVLAALDADDETGVVRQVAIKRLRPEGVLRKLPLIDAVHLAPAERAECARAQFERERHLWSQLRPHPNVVRALRASRLDGQPVLVLEYIHGASLAAMIGRNVAGRGGKPGRRAQRVPLLEVVDLLRQLASAFMFLHRTARIAHGDLSAANVLYSGTGRILLSDFGLAVPLRRAPVNGYAAGRFPDSTANPFRAGLVPPDEADGAGASPAGDLWRLGVTAAMALSGTQRGDPAFTEVDGATRTLRDPAGFLRRAVRRGFEEEPDHPLRAPLLDLLTGLLGAPTGPTPADGATAEAWLAGASGGFADALVALRERDELRDRLGRLGAGGGTERDVSTTARAIADLEEAWSLRPRDFPETGHLAAAAAWQAYRQAPTAALADLAFEWSHRSLAAYPGDPRVRGLFVESRRARTQPGSVFEVGARCREVQSEAVLVRSFGSFLRASRLRDLVRELREEATNLRLLAAAEGKPPTPDADALEAAAEEAAAVLAEFDRAVTDRLHALEDRLSDLERIGGG